MVDLIDILTAGVLVAVMPTLLALLIAYSIIAVILGVFLWTAKSVPDDVGIAIVLSGLTVGGLLIIFALFARLVFS